MNDVDERYVDCGECVDYNDPEVRAQARSWRVQEGRSGLLLARVTACTEAH